MPTPTHYGLPRKTLHSNGLFQWLLRLIGGRRRLGVLFSVHYARMPPSSVHF